MALRPGDHKIGRRLSRPADFGPNAGIARLESAVGDARPIAADRRVELVAAPRVDSVIDAVDPFGIGTETRRAAHIERQMHAEPRMLWHGIDEALKWGAARKREINAAAIVISWDRRRRNSRDAPRQRRRVKPGAVDEQIAVERHPLAAADLEREAVARDAAFEHRRTQHHAGAGILGIGLISLHQRMAVDDAGRGRMEGGDATQRRLHRARIVAVEPFEIGDARRFRMFDDALERRGLVIAHADDELADALMRYVSLSAIGVELLAPLDAEARFQTAFGIIETGM